jgi:protein SMG6
MNFETNVYFNAQAILNERVKVELEVRPKLLIADTNCYIDHLATLRRLIQEKHYTLIAPLVGKLGDVCAP